MKEERYLKTVEAVYKAIEFLSEEEPLKNKIKEKALSVLGNLIFISLSAYGNPVSFFSGDKKQQILIKCISDIETLKNYLKVGKSQGWMDSFNFLILIKEYDIIKEKIEKELDKKEKIIPKEVFSDRQTKILDVLKKEEKVQVSDLKKTFPDTSKRTLRRDLEDLMKKNKVIRLGEWNQIFYKLELGRTRWDRVGQEA